MTRELPDELLSAYLDGEVTAEERAAVEAHLATSDAARQLLSELQSLRSDMGALPRAKVATDFSDRVVQAAVAAKEANQPVAMPARPARRGWMVVAAAVAAAAACLLVAVQFWRPDSPPVALPVPTVDPLIAAFHSALPEDGQAVVLRVRAPKDMPLTALEVASAIAGIGSQVPSARTGGSELAAAYRSQLEQRIGAALLANSTVSAAEAVFVESPVANLEKMLAALQQNAKGSLELRREAQLAFPRLGALPGDDTGEGSDAANLVQGAAIYLQHLPANMLRLEKQTTPVAAATPSGTVNPDRIVRVLILIEQVETQ